MWAMGFCVCALVLFPMLLMYTAVVFQAVFVKGLTRPTVATIRYGNLGSGLDLGRSLKSQWDVFGRLTVFDHYPLPMHGPEKTIYREFASASEARMAGEVWLRDELATVEGRLTSRDGSTKSRPIKRLFSNALM